MNPNTVKIPNLTHPAMIAAFFGGPESYDYTVTAEEFDEQDNEGPGHYCGVIVSAEDGAKWDAGLQECKSRGVANRSLEGLRVRLGMFGREKDADALFAKLDDLRVAPILASWEKEVGGCKLVPFAKIPDMFVVVRENQSPEKLAYINAVVKRAVKDFGWAAMRKQEQYDAEFLAILRALWSKTCPGLERDKEGNPIPDSQLFALHSHYGLAHHLGGEAISEWPKANFYFGATVIVTPPKELPPESLSAMVVAEAELKAPLAKNQPVALPEAPAKRSGIRH